MPAQRKLTRPDKAALGRHYKDEQGIIAYILGNLGNNNRTAMGKNQARVFLDDNYTKGELVTIFGQPFQNASKTDVIEFIVNGSELADLVVEDGQVDKTAPFELNSPEFNALFTLPSSNDGNGGGGGEVVSTNQEVRELCESHKDNYHVPGLGRHHLSNILLFCNYFMENGSHPPQTYKVGDVALGKLADKWRNNGGMDSCPSLKALLTHAGFYWGNLNDLEFTTRVVHKILICHQQHGESAQDYYSPEVKRYLRRLVRGNSSHRSSRLATLREIGVNIDDFTPNSIYRNQASVNEVNLALLQEYIGRYGNCNIPYPDLQLYEPRYNGVYTWLADIRHQYANEDLTNEDDIILKLISINVPLEYVPRRRLEHRAGGRMLDELKTQISEIIGEHVIVMSEVAIDDQPQHSRSLDVAIRIGVRSVNAGGDFIALQVCGEFDEHGHSGISYTEESEQRKQYKATTSFQEEGVDIVLYVRGNMGSTTEFDIGPGRLHVQKWVDVISAGIDRASTLSLQDTFVAEMHMIDYVEYHPHVLENKSRIMPCATSPRAEVEDHWDDRCIWDKMFLHYSGAAIGGRRNDARESEGEGMEAGGEGKAEEEYLAE